MPSETGTHTHPFTRDVVQIRNTTKNYNFFTSAPPSGLRLKGLGTCDQTGQKEQADSDLSQGTQEKQSASKETYQCCVLYWCAASQKPAIQSVSRSVSQCVSLSPEGCWFRQPVSRLPSTGGSQQLMHCGGGVYIQSVCMSVLLSSKCSGSVWVYISTQCQSVCGVFTLTPHQGPHLLTKPEFFNNKWRGLNSESNVYTDSLDYNRCVCHDFNHNGWDDHRVKLKDASLVRSSISEKEQLVREQ